MCGVGLSIANSPLKLRSLDSQGGITFCQQNTISHTQYTATLSGTAMCMDQAARCQVSNCVSDATLLLLSGYAGIRNTRIDPNRAPRLWRNSCVQPRSPSNCCRLATSNQFTVQLNARRFTENEIIDNLNSYLSCITAACSASSSHSSCTAAGPILLCNS